MIKSSNGEKTGRILAIILAAGRSERFSSLKQLCKLRGKSLIEIAVGNAIASGTEAVVVLGHKWKTVARHIRSRKLRCSKVVNRQYNQGQFSSLRYALTRYNMKKYSGFLIYPVDYAVVRKKTIRTLISSFFRDKKHMIFSPVHRGRMGHPVLISTAILDEFFSLPPDATARDVIYKDMKRIRKVFVNDMGIYMDVDTPADLMIIRGLKN